MNKILLALAILGAGTAGSFTAHYSTIKLQREANVTREAWVVQTQLLAVAQSDQVGLSEHIRKLKNALAQARAVEENALWSALQTNRAGHFTPELRERLLEEFGFNWQSSPDFIVVSKDALREIHMQTIGDDKLTDLAVTVLALTPGERGQVEAAMQRVQTDFKDWAVAHTERTEPKDDVVAQYTLLNDPAMSISNNFVTGVFEALGRERAELIMPNAKGWMNHVGIYGYPITIVLKHQEPVGPDSKPIYSVASEKRLSFKILSSNITSGPSPLYYPFHPAFLPIFPNGWADVAKREGFELPDESPEK